LTVASPPGLPFQYISLMLRPSIIHQMLRSIS
jgi:hypothetical protein